MLDTLEKIETLYTEFRKDLQSDDHDATPEFFIEVVEDNEAEYGKLNAEAVSEFLEKHN